MKRLCFLLTTCLLFTLAACAAPATSEVPTAVATSVPTRTPRPTPEPSPTLIPPIVIPTATVDDAPLAMMTTELSATVVAGLPPTPTPDQANGAGGLGLEGVSAQALRSPDGWPQLWAVASHGMSVGDPSQVRFVAIYTHAGGNW